MLLSMMLSGSIAQADDNCRRAHDPVKGGSIAPCTGVLIPFSVAVDCAVLKHRSQTWKDLFAKEQEACIAKLDGLNIQIELEKQRTASEKKRGDKHEAALKALASMPAQEPVPIWQRAELWAPLMLVVGIVATVAVYETVRN